jgi:hypothetical protein
MQAVNGALAVGGALIVALPEPSKESGPKELFYLRFWPDSVIKACFTGFRSTAAVPFRNGSLFALVRPSTSTHPL